MLKALEEPGRKRAGSDYKAQNCRLSQRLCGRSVGALVTRILVLWANVWIEAWLLWLFCPLEWKINDVVECPAKCRQITNAIRAIHFGGMHAKQCHYVALHFTPTRTLFLILLDFTLIFLFSRLKELLSCTIFFYGFAFSFAAHIAVEICSQVVQAGWLEDLPHLLHRPLSHTHYLCERQQRLWK